VIDMSHKFSIPVCFRVEFSFRHHPGPLSDTGFGRIFCQIALVGDNSGSRFRVFRKAEPLPWSNG
jgi:hypothetical protein